MGRGKEKKPEVKVLGDFLYFSVPVLSMKVKKKKPNLG